MLDRGHFIRIELPCRRVARGPQRANFRPFLLGAVLKNRSQVETARIVLRPLERDDLVGRQLERRPELRLSPNEIGFERLFPGQP